ncbi:RagB/SusD family nutrient uptake outer membrane protein [Pinibacter soli]|uniref:RagB/SusD family nutrient uptake outer membrane protein n=1 Tax=Pinibacter soli TaxID=3044211 RepID=A0ABT6RFE1_9BACT|nr:RagB/SusD family nutrient uptake outer membrane protein [Pinibacter soli]MDI3321281.1 RagB/SusD family nutrient uptake outer membrane protein [Pinibacter soli]
MKRRFKLQYIILASLTFLCACLKSKEPETTFTDAAFWNTESDLKVACNRLYALLEGFNVISDETKTPPTFTNIFDNRGDDVVGTAADATSNGSRNIPSTSDDWSRPYKTIFTSNNILEKGQQANVTDATKNRYFAEAKFFRAYAYFQLLKKYGDIPLVMKVLDIGSPELTMARTPRATVVDTMYADLDFAAQWLPTRLTMPAADYGRVTKGAALAFKARVALYEGTRSKYHNYGDPKKHLNIAVDAASKVMDPAQGYGLLASYENNFQYAGEGNVNTENVFVKIYGASYLNTIVVHDNSRRIEGGNVTPTRNLVDNYLCTDGLPWGKSPLTVSPEKSYNDVFSNRDPRLNKTIYKMGEQSYKGLWLPAVGAQRSGYACKKGYIQADWDNLGKANVDKQLIRYAEVLLTYAEAKFELNDAITDADLNASINKLRTRVGMPAAVNLTNAFVTANGLNMRDEIRRERTVELALEGFRYDDLMRWKLAETLLPKAILGGRYAQAEWTSTPVANVKNTLTADSLIIVEPAGNRRFDPARDYLYPVPLNEITLSGGSVTQNPNWK